MVVQVALERFTLLRRSRKGWGTSVLGVKDIVPFRIVVELEGVDEAMLLFPASARFPAEEALFAWVDAVALFLLVGQGEELLGEGELLVDFCL